MPPGATLYAHLGTQIAGQWLYQDTVFSTAAAAPPSPTSPIVLVYPQAAAAIDIGLPFEWSIGGPVEAAPAAAGKGMKRSASA